MLKRGDEVENYVVEELIGGGGMARIYKVRHRLLGTAHALKVLDPRFREQPEVRSRFLSEGMIGAKLGHPNVVRVTDTVSTPEVAGLVMELVEGTNLEEHLKALAAPMTSDEIKAIFGPVLDALGEAHRAGLVHRDIKPANILLERTEGGFVPKVTDFGIAKVTAAAKELGEGKKGSTHVDAKMGTLAYMSPEQLRAPKSVDARADVFSLGATLYEMLTGAVAFDAESEYDVMHRIVENRYAPIEEARRRRFPDDSSPLDPALAKATRKALMPRPEDRFQSCAEFAAALEAECDVPEAAPEESPAPIAAPTAAPTPPPEPPVDAIRDEKLRGSRLPLLLGGGVAIVAAALGVMALRGRDRAALVTVAGVDGGGAPAAPALDAQKIKSKSLEVITAAIRDGDPAVRRAALDAVAAGRDPRHATLVEPLLTDADLEVRVATANCLARLGARDALGALRSASGKAALVDPWIDEARRKLGDDEGRRRLKQLLGSHDDGARLAAAVCLGATGDAEARKMLLGIAGGPQARDNPELAIRVLEPLSRSGDRQAIARLVDRLSAPLPSRLLAAEALSKIGEPRGREVLDRESSGPPVTAMRARLALSQLGDKRSLGTFLATLSDRARSSEERVLSARGLGAAGTRSELRAVADALEDAEVAVRLAAAGAALAILAAVPDALAQRSLDWAASGLASDSWVLRAQATAILAHGDPARTVPLLGKAIHDPNVEVRRTAARSLGRTGAAAAVPVLKDALQDSEGAVRITALRSLGKLTDPSAATTLSEHLAHAGPADKVVAAGELVRLGQTAHAGEVQQAIASSDAEVRRLAAEECAAAPSVLGPAAAGLLKDPSFEVRLAAAAALAQAGQQSGEAVLREALARGGATSLTAYVALNQLGQAPSVPLDPESLVKSGDSASWFDTMDLVSTLPSLAAMPILSAAMQAADAGLRVQALQVAGELALHAKSDEATTLLHLAAFEDDPAARVMAEVVTARIANREPAPAPAEAPHAVAAAAPAPAPADAGTTTPSAELKTLTAAEESRDAVARGSLALARGRYQEAIRNFQRAHSLNPSAKVAFQLAEAYRQYGRTQSDPKARDDYYRKAIAAYKQSKDPRADDYIRELSALIK